MFGDFLGYFEVCQFLRKETTQVSLWANLGCFQFQHLVTLYITDIKNSTFGCKSKIFLLYDKLGFSAWFINA